ncbi:MAG: glycosyltransferase family 2 protein [Patescibacteria group bacterium]
MRTLFSIVKNIMTKISIVILSYNTKEYLIKALKSVALVAEKDWEIIVVDNASTDGSPEIVKHKFPSVTLIRNKNNLGFAGGNNIGMQRAKGQYVMLLNSDAELLANSTLEPLVEYMDTHANVAMVTPRLMLPDGTIDMASHRGFPTPWNALTYFSGCEKVFGALPLLNRIFGGYHQTWKDLSTIHDVDACSCAAVIVRSSALKKVGLLDDRFFMYAEDLDWCLRFKEAGWRVVYNPTTRVLHHKNKSGIHKETSEDGEEDGEKHGYTTKHRAHTHFFQTMIQFYEKHYLVRYPRWVRRVVFVGIHVIQHMKGVHHASTKNNDAHKG